MADILYTTTTELLVVQETNNQQLVDNSETVTLTVTESSPILLEVNQQGPPGPAGSGMQTEQCLAEYTIGGNRAVTVNSNNKLEYPNLLSDTSFIVGVTQQSAGANEPCLVQILGTQQEPSWNWTPGLPVYVGNSGTLTQAVPVTGQVIVVGYALTSTSIMIDKQTNIFRG